MITAEQAITNATRLLERAEIELTNLPLMACLDEMAVTWLKVAELVTERERV